MCVLGELWRRLAVNTGGLGEGAIVFGFRCRQGRHRSVAMATLAAECLLAAGCEVEVDHLCLNGYGRTACGCPDACTVVRDAGLLECWRELGLEALAGARADWEGLFQ